MHLFDELNGNNYVLFAAKHYQNRQCESTDEFYRDLNQFKYLKKLINRFLKEEENDDMDKVFRLITNHIITIYNVFEMMAAHKMMIYKLDDLQMQVVKPILLKLGYITERDFINVSLHKGAIDKCRKI